jgi:sugar lactone lactonase YvrE
VSDIRIESVRPGAALPGGEVRIEYAGPDASGRPEVKFGQFDAQVLIASSRTIVARVPEQSSESGTTSLTVSGNGGASADYPYETGRRLATNLHPVANPALDAEGNIYAAYSGRRGQQTQVSVYRITPSGAVTPHATGIANATGLAFAIDGTLYVSSRQNGNVYTVRPNGQTEIYTEGMGIATGLAFDHNSNLYVGDRSGSIFKISPDKEIFVFATLEPSVAAYHLAYGPDDYLYVSGPTTSSNDCIYRISPTGEVGKLFTGLGRPQGLAFDTDGRLYAVASWRGWRGIFRFDTAGSQPELAVSGMGLVGLAFDQSGNLIVADGSAVYRVHAGPGGRGLR